MKGKTIGLRYRVTFWHCVQAAARRSSSRRAFHAGRDGHDTIPAFVNGKGPFAFILDTGADGSALYQWFAEKEHLPKGEVRDMDGQTGSVSSPTYSLKALSVDGHAIPYRYGSGRIGSPAARRNTYAGFYQAVSLVIVGWYSPVQG